MESIAATCTDAYGAPQTSSQTLRGRPRTTLSCPVVGRPPSLAFFPFAHVIGGILIAAGLPILLDSFARFALQGLGTPAPVMPPKHLVVTGFYRYVRI